MRIRLCANDGNVAASAARASLRRKIAALGHEVVGDGAADVVIALGGDGTLLHAVHEFPGLPILGFNLGGLGYLASVGRRDFDRALELLAAGRYKISRRTMLEVRAGRGESALALNDVVIARESSGHAIRLDLEADGRPVTRYLADGLIVATPTGSTAYSLAAGGPVVMPDSASFVVTPMNPHALGVRPMVVNDSVAMTVATRARDGGRDGRIVVYADGENVFTLEDGGSVDIRKSSEFAAIVEFDGHDPYEVLARKLGWSGQAKMA